jgi:hypothetical protein
MIIYTALLSTFCDGSLSPSSLALKSSTEIAEFVVTPWFSDFSWIFSLTSTLLWVTDGAMTSVRN